MDPDNIMKGMINDITFSCRHSSSGCSESFSKDLLLKHEECCIFRQKSEDEKEISQCHNCFETVDT